MADEGNGGVVRYNIRELFDKIDSRFDKLDSHLTAHDARLSNIEFQLRMVGEADKDRKESRKALPAWLSTAAAYCALAVSVVLAVKTLSG